MEAHCNKFGLVNCEKVSAYPNPINATIGRRFFLNKIPPKMDIGSSDLHWHSLEDLYQGYMDYHS